MTSPAFILQSLVPTTVVNGSTGWTSKIGRMLDAPNQLVVFYDSGGQNPNPRWLVDYSMVMVHVRGNTNDYNGAYTKIRQVRDCLLGLDSQDVGADRLVSIICMGDIGFLNYDDANRPTFSVNFRVIIEPADNALTQREPL
jgi:hypothetical protein